MFAVAIVIVAIPVAISVDRLLDGRVDNGQRECDIGRIGRENALAHQFKETGIDDCAFVVSSSTVGDGDSIAVGGIAVSIDALEVIAPTERSTGCKGPVLHHALPVISSIIV